MLKAGFIESDPNKGTLHSGFSVVIVSIGFRYGIWQESLGGKLWRVKGKRRFIYDIDINYDRDVNIGKTYQV